MVAPSAAPSPYSSYYPAAATVKSDRNRLVAGLLQLFLPGVGRMYLGYVAIGVLQLLSCLCGIGLIWAFIDALIILSGGVKYDGYMRRLDE